MEYPREVLVPVEEELNQFRREFARSNCLPIGLFPYFLLRFGRGRFAAYGGAWGAPLNPVGYQRVKGWGLGDEGRVESSHPRSGTSLR